MPVALLWKADEVSLVQILKNDSANASRLDDIATRLVATWAKFGTLDPEAEARGMPLDPNQRRAQPTLFKPSSSTYRGCALTTRNQRGTSLL